jgi:hypothetical protein
MLRVHFCARSSMEDSHSGLVRTPGTRVGLTPSGVQIPYPPPFASKRSVTHIISVVNWALAVSLPIQREPSPFDKGQRCSRAHEPAATRRLVLL